MKRTRYQLGSLTREARKAGPAVWIYRWREGDVHRKTVVGDVKKFRTKADAMAACEQLRRNANRQVKTPHTVGELISHYREKELPKGKSPSTRDGYECYLNTWILPMWSEYKLSDVRTVAVESWLQSVPLSLGSRAKIRNVMSALFSHAMRWELYDRNPITLVRQSAKREKVPDVLKAEEIRSLLSELQEPYRTMVFLVATTALRASELLALQWQDVDFDAGQIRLSRGIVHQKITAMKTEASRKPLPLTTEWALVLANWRAKCAYNQSHDWVFASLAKKGTQPLWPENVLRRHVRPAAMRAGITKRIGFHTFRHSFATILRSNREDIKTAQELLRHANSKVTMDTYTQAFDPAKIAAQERLADMFVPICSRGSA